ncbi:hypothetical protein [Kytococcus sp. Marseille-QA3725]
MTPVFLFLSALLFLLLGVLVLDLRAVGRPVRSTTGMLLLASRQASHCDGCRRAVHLRARPWVMVSMAVILIGLACGALMATSPSVPSGVPGSVLCLTALLAVLPLAVVNHRASRHVRESTGHDPGL